MMRCFCLQLQYSFGLECEELQSIHLRMPDKTKDIQLPCQRESTSADKARRMKLRIPWTEMTLILYCESSRILPPAQSAASGRPIIRKQKKKRVRIFIIVEENGAGKDFKGFIMIKVAQIINTRGLKGECKLYLYTDDPDHRFEPGRTLYIEEKEPVTVVSYSESKNLGYARFEGITTIEQAEKLKGKNLYLPMEELPETEEGEYYYHQLNGCRVLNEAGEDTGTVSDILETGANLVLRVGKGKNSYLLPFVDAFVLDVNVPEKIITIREMEGLRGGKSEPEKSKPQKQGSKPKTETSQPQPEDEAPAAGENAKCQEK